MTHPKRVRCSPLGREERVADVVDVAVRANGDVIYSVEVSGHRFGVDADAVEPIEDEAA